MDITKFCYTSVDVLVSSQKDKNISSKYILSFVKSPKLFYLWLYHRGKRKGKLLSWYLTPLSEIPIADYTSGAKPFVDIVDKILNLVYTDNFQKDTQKQESVALEEELDQLAKSMDFLKLVNPTC